APGRRPATPAPPAPRPKASFAARNACPPPCIARRRTVVAVRRHGYFFTFRRDRLFGMRTSRRKARAPRGRQGLGHETAPWADPGRDRRWAGADVRGHAL